MEISQNLDELMQRRIRIAIGDLVLQLQQAHAMIEHLQQRVAELEKSTPPVRRKPNGDAAQRAPADVANLL